MTVLEKLNLLLKVVCHEMFVEAEDVKGESRVRDIVTARHIFCSLSRKHLTNGGRKWNAVLNDYEPTTVSCKTVGNFINRHHTAPVHSMQTLSDWMDTNQQLKEKVGRIECRLLAEMGVSKQEQPKAEELAQE